jgi:hypothetical protein
MRMSKKTSQRLLPVFILFILALAVRSWYIPQKEGLLMDETYSYIISLRNEVGFTRNFEDTVYSGKEIRTIAFGDKASVKEVLSDVYQLHKDTEDPVHPSLYYSLLRVWIGITGGQTGDLQSMILQGCLLNLLFFSVSFFFMYLLVRRIFLSQWMVLLALFVAFFNTGSISNAIYIREYLLQETFFIIVTYLFVRLYQQMEQKKSIDSWQNLCLIAISLCLFLSTGYFTVIYVAFCFMALMYKSHQEKQNQHFLFLTVAFIMAFIFAEALYCRYFGGFSTSSSYHSREALDKIKHAVFHNVCYSTSELFSLIEHYLFYFWVVLVSLFVVLYRVFKRKESIKEVLKNDKILIIIISASFLWAFTVMILTTWKFVRYILPVFPLLSLCIPWITAKLNGKKQALLMGFYVLTYLIVALFPNRITYLFKGVPQKVFNQTPEVPVIIVRHNPYVYFYVELLPYLPDNQQYEFAESAEETIEKLKKYKEVFIVVENEMEKISFPDSYEVKDQFNCQDGYFSGYRIIKKD